MDRLTWTVLVEQAPRTIIEHQLPGQPDHHFYKCHIGCVAATMPRLSVHLVERIIGSAQEYVGSPTAVAACHWCHQPFNVRPHYAFLPQPKVGRLSRQVGAGAFAGERTGSYPTKNPYASLFKNLPWRFGTSARKYLGDGPCVQNLPRVVGKPPELGMEFKPDRWRK